MASTGARGSALNIGQMAGSLDNNHEVDKD